MSGVDYKELLRNLAARRGEDMDGNPLPEATAQVPPTVFKTDGGTGGGDGAPVGFENMPQMGSGVKLATSQYVSPNAYDEVEEDGTIYEDCEGEQSEDRCEGHKAAGMRKLEAPPGYVVENGKLVPIERSKFRKKATVKDPRTVVNDLTKTPLLDGFNPASRAELNDATAGMQSQPSQFNPDNLNEQTGINADNAIQTANTLAEPYSSGEATNDGKLSVGMDKNARLANWGPLRFLSDYLVPAGAGAGATWYGHQQGLPWGAALPLGIGAGTIASPRGMMRAWQQGAAKQRRIDMRTAKALGIPDKDVVFSSGIPAGFDASKDLLMRKALIGGVGSVPALLASVHRSAGSTEKATEEAGGAMAALSDIGLGMQEQAQLSKEQMEMIKKWGKPAAGVGLGLAGIWAISKIRDMFRDSGTSKSKPKPPPKGTRRRRRVPKIRRSCQPDRSDEEGSFRRWRHGIQG
jgi:hypothetical protein